MASKLSQIQARFQQKQMQEKEEKLLRLYESQQQRAIDRVNRGSAGSNTSATSNHAIQGGKVRQMFDERRQKAGIDRSYPLEPLRITKSNGYNGNSNLDNTSTRIVVKQTVKKDTVQIKNGKPIVNKRETTHRVYNNNNGDENFQEQNIFTDNLNRPVLNRTYRRKDLEMMMREHRENDNIDDEEFPDINIDDFEEPLPKPKLNNVRSIQLENESFIQNSTSPKTILRNRSNDKPDSPPKQETKPLVKKVVPKTIKSSPSKDIVSNKNYTPPSPIRSVTKQTTPPMSSKPPQKTGDSRTPSTARPSSKQTSRKTSSVARDDLQSCKYCERRFLEDRLAVHEDICAKTLKKKRKTYDATKHRVQGTELEPYTRKLTKSMLQKSSNNSSILGNSKSKQQTAQQAKAPPKKNDWRRKHEEFISAIRAAKMAQAHIAKGGKLSDLPPPPPSENPDYVQCPHCGRKFNESAAERHIPKCANYSFNKTKPPVRQGPRK